MFTVIARFLVQMNSVVNPIVYATTIPEFKKTIRNLLDKNWRKKKMEENYTTIKSQITSASKSNV